ncbi:GNAT family N-acetyltransferase [Streptomyces sp. NPDC000594]|uniref:GNAT family N-acetyltransferase n=1 Tax=Streptomyces sp. NPDC000594 TaxID=3154261 RepID=UPI00331CC271
MTTTLRPNGPLQHRPDGARLRAYDVCDNGRPVGAVEIATVGRLGSWAGTITGLRIDPAQRRRGRGTIAALAAEEVLRGWGCAEVQISVPPDAEAATGLATVLGYTERGRNMAKELGPEPPALPEGARGRPMTEAEYTMWSEASLTLYARDWVERGLTPEQARDRAEGARALLLPDGRATEGVWLSVLEQSGGRVGFLCVGRREVLPGRQGHYVYEVEVAEGRRGAGHGRSLMLLAERYALADGARLLGLHVFAGNTTALGLYTSLGYRTTAVNSVKRLL